MRFASIFAMWRRASSRLRLAPRPASCLLAVEVLEDRNAPGSVALNVVPNEPGAPVFAELAQDALSEPPPPNHPTTTPWVNLDNGKGASPPAEPASHWAPRTPDSRGPASDLNIDQPEIVTPDSQSMGSVAALLLASGASHSALAAMSGTISADNATFIPIRQEGCVITFLHPDVHDLTGSVQGQYTETGILTLNVCTGRGFFRAEGVIDGSVLGSQSGTATLRIEGVVRDFVFIDQGHFVITQGEGGLAGVHAAGTFAYTVGVGGTYQGLAHFDDRR